MRNKTQKQTCAENSEMREILSIWKIDKYTVIELDAEVPLKPFNKYLIGGKIYDYVPIYDLPRCIAVKTDDDINADTVEFII